MVICIAAIMVVALMPIEPGHIQKAYADEDSTAPILNEFKVLDTSVDRPGVVRIQLDIAEEDSGFSDFSLSLKWKKGNVDQSGSISTGLEYGGAGGDMCSNFQLSLDKNGKQFGDYSGTYLFDLYIGKDANISEYSITQLWIRDKYGNTKTYDGEVISTLAAEGKKTFAITGDNSGEDLIAPVLKGYKIINSSISRPGTVQIQLDVFEEGAGFSDFSLSLKWKKGNVDQSGSISTGLEYGGAGGDMCSNFKLSLDKNSKQFGSGSGLYTFNLDVGEKTNVSEYTVTELWIRDKNGNSTSYKLNDLSVLAPSSGNIFYVLGDAGNDDISAPMLNSFEIINTTVNRPGILKLKVNITEEGSGLSDIGISLRWKKDGKTKSGSISTGLEYGGAGGDMCSNFEFWNNNNTKNFGGKTGLYIFTLLIGDKADLSTYTIDNIWLRDKYGNTVNVGVNDTSGKCSNIVDYSVNKDNTFILKDEFNYSFTTGTNNTELAKKLRNMPEDTAAKVEILGNKVLSKECLDAIKGENKTIVAYSKGLQWIIKGEDLTGKTKDLHLGVSISSMGSGDYFADGDNANERWTLSDPSVRLIFYPNGELPGKMQIRFKSDTLYDKGISGNAPSLYYYDGNKLVLESTDSDLNFDGTDKWCYINITHNSQFAVSNTSNLKLKKMFGLIKGESAKVGGNVYKATSKSAVTFTKAVNKKSVSIPSSVKIRGKSYYVTRVGRDAFKGKRIRKVLMGSNVEKLDSKCFNKSFVNFLIVQTKKLNKANQVKSCFAGSKAKKVTIKYGKIGKKYVQKSFTPKNTRAKRIVLKK